MAWCSGWADAFAHIVLGARPVAGILEHWRSQRGEMPVTVNCDDELIVCRRWRCVLLTVEVCASHMRRTVFRDCKSRRCGCGACLRRESCKVGTELGGESVAVMALQMDKCCSFILPLHKVVFNRIRKVGLMPTNRSRADIQICRDPKQWQVNPNRSQ